jgi:hypothetical protein
MKEIIEEEKEKIEKDFSSQGKKNRASGRRFETRIRAELEGLGWIVDKWTNTVDYDKENGIGKIVPAKRKYNPFKKMLVIGTGFPDFICFKKVKDEEGGEKGYDIIGVEVKANGYLDQIEKGMCLWLLENKIFSRILIAKKGKKRGQIEYVDFNIKYRNKEK